MRRLLFKSNQVPVFKVDEQFVRLESTASPWTGLCVEVHRLPPLEDEPDLVPHQHTLSIHLSQKPCNLEWKIGGQFENRVMRQGDVCLFPAHTALPAGRWDQSVDILRVAIEPSFFDRIATQEGMATTSELPLRRDIVDARIFNLAQVLKVELEDDCPNGAVFGDSIATALVIHLLKRYATRPLVIPNYASGLEPAQLRRVTDFLRANLDQKVTLEQLAELVDVSQFHFARLFKRSTGLSPHQYLIKLRVEQAKDLLLNRNLSIADVAQAVGFTDQSHLTNHFKSLLGISPGKYRSR